MTQTLTRKPKSTNSKATAKSKGTGKPKSGGNSRLATTKAAENEALVAALNNAMMVVEFELDGTVINANENFLAAVGCDLDEVQGQHHRIFEPENSRDSLEYQRFWEKLQSGEHQTGVFQRIGKGGKEFWIQASYNPITDRQGRLTKVFKVATDITEHVRLQQASDRQAQELKHVMEAVASNAELLRAAADQLTRTSNDMTCSSEETSAQASIVSTAADEVSANVQTVAAGVEEMGASIREIAGNASQAASVAQEAVNVADQTNRTISKLGDSSNEIGKVIKVITSIAEQTNLLALNATIEAARAGEAGKGFAVVANEVKELAKETARATEDIGHKISAIQHDTRSAVDAINQISHVIDQINDISNTIASAVEEQTATTNEMSRNVAEAAKGSSEIAQNITSVANNAHNTTRGAVDSQRAADDLSKMAIELQQVVAHYRQNEAV